MGGSAVRSRPITIVSCFASGSSVGWYTSLCSSFAPPITSARPAAAASSVGQVVVDRRLGEVGRAGFARQHGVLRPSGGDHDVLHLRRKTLLGRGVEDEDLVGRVDDRRHDRERVGGRHGRREQHDAAGHQQRAEDADRDQHDRGERPPTGARPIRACAGSRRDAHRPGPHPREGRRSDPAGRSFSAPPDGTGRQAVAPSAERRAACGA